MKVPRRSTVLLLTVTLLVAATSAAREVEVPLRQWQAPLVWSASLQPVRAGDDKLADPSGSRPEALALPSPEAMFVAIAPCRMIDTRPLYAAAYAPGTPLQPGATVTFDLDSAPAPCNGIPSTAVAFSLNVTVVSPSAPGFLAAFPGSTPPNPLTSLLNFVAGDVIANASVVPCDDNGIVGFIAAARADLVVDINGYYSPYTANVVTSVTGTPPVTSSGGTTPAISLNAGGITTGYLAADSVTALAIASGAVGSMEIAADAVTAPKIAAGAVGTSEIADGAIGAADIADGGVTTAKIADGAVTAAKVVTSEKFVPTGTILPFASDVAPSGFLFCNGAMVSRTTYADLYSVIGTRWGSGDGSTTFNLPDLRGRFLRGWNSASGRDPDVGSRTACGSGGLSGDNVGTCQPDEFKSHTHNVFRNNGSGVAGGTNANYLTIVLPQSQVSTATGGSESRPLNASVSFIIKY